MSLWGSANTQAAAPKFGLAGTGGSANGVLLTGNTAFQNVRISAFVANTALGVFPVSAAQRANTGNTTPGEGLKTQHAGWNFRKAGTGPVQSVAISSGGTGYTPGGGYITVTGGGGNAGGLGNTTANLFFQANAAGSVVNVTINIAGSYASTPSTNVNGSGGTPATVVLTMGGRCNRVTYETLVASGNVSANAADINLFPF